MFPAFSRRRCDATNVGRSTFLDVGVPPRALFPRFANFAGSHRDPRVSIIRERDRPTAKFPTGRVVVAYLLYGRDGRTAVTPRLRDDDTPHRTVPDDRQLISAGKSPASFVRTARGLRNARYLPRFGIVKSVGLSRSPCARVPTVRIMRAEGIEGPREVNEERENERGRARGSDRARFEVALKIAYVSPALSVLQLTSRSVYRLLALPSFIRPARISESLLSLLSLPFLSLSLSFSFSLSFLSPFLFENAFRIRARTDRARCDLAREAAAVDFRRNLSSVNYSVSTISCRAAAQSAAHHDSGRQA